MPIILSVVCDNLGNGKKHNFTYVPESMYDKTPFGVFSVYLTLGQYPDLIIRILEQQDCMGDLLSRFSALNLGVENTLKLSWALPSH